MTVLDKLESLASSYKALETNKELNEETLPEKYQEMFELLQDLSGLLAEEQSNKIASLLEAQLEEDMEKAAQEIEKQFPPLPEETLIPIEEGEPFDQGVILSTFLDESSGLVNYKKEANLKEIYSKTSRLLRLIPSTVETAHETDFIALFIDDGSMMVQRRNSISKLILRYGNTGNLSENMKRLMNGVFAYADQPATKKAMIAMAKAIEQT